MNGPKKPWINYQMTFQWTYVFNAICDLPCPLLLIKCLFKYDSCKKKIDACKDPQNQKGSKSYLDTLYLDDSFARLENFVTRKSVCKSK